MLKSPKSEWTRIWHLWTIIITKRAIVGRFIVGRRDDGRLDFENMAAAIDNFPVD
jgi:hypothetical protein